MTGNMGSGKTTVLNSVRSPLVGKVSADKIVSGLYKNEAVKKKLVKKFGTAKRKEIAGIAFSSKAKRKQLEKILHPLVWKEIKSRTSAFKKKGKKLVIVEAPLLFEAGWQKKFDKAILVRAGKKKCVARLVKKGMGKKEAGARLEAQMPESKKIKACQFSIDNNGQKARAIAKAKRIVKELMDG